MELPVPLGIPIQYPLDKMERGKEAERERERARQSPGVGQKDA